MDARKPARVFFCGAIALGVCGLLYTILIPHVPNCRFEGSCQAYLSVLQVALNNYKLDHGTFPPPEGGGLARLREKGPRGWCYYEFKDTQRDAQGRVTDIWGNPIVYQLCGIPPRVILWSAGPNGKYEDGKGDDITNESDR